MNGIRKTLLWAAAFAVGMLIGRGFRTPHSETIAATASPQRAVVQDMPAPTSTDFKQLIQAQLKGSDESASHLSAQAASTLRRWAESDFEGALAFAKSLKDSRTRSLTLGTVLAARADANPEGTWRLVRESIKTHSNVVFYAFFHEWARTNRAAAVRFADTHPVVDDHYLGGRDLLDLDGLHPATLAPLIASVKRDEFRQNLINHLARLWPENDLAGLFAFQNAMPTPLERPPGGSFAGGRVFDDWVKRDPLAAANAVATLRSDMTRKDAWKDLALTALDDTRYEAVQALLHSPHATTFAAAIADALDVGARAPGADALLRLLPEGAAKQTIIAKLAQKAAERFDTASAQALLNQLPEGQGGEVFATLAEQWFRADPAQAAAWMNSLAAGSNEHSWAQAGAVRRLALDDLDRAIALAETIPDPAARKAAITAMTYSISRLGTPTQQAWLQQRPELTPIERMEWASGMR